MMVSVPPDDEEECEEEESGSDQSWDQWCGSEWVLLGWKAGAHLLWAHLWWHWGALEIPSKSPYSFNGTQSTSNLQLNKYKTTTCCELGIVLHRDRLINRNGSWLSGFMAKERDMDTDQSRTRERVVSAEPDVLEVLWMQRLVLRGAALRQEMGPGTGDWKLQPGKS